MSRPLRKDAAAALERWVAWAVTLIPLAGFALAIALARGAGALEFGLCLGFGLATLLGITAGYHRLFAHHSFKADDRVRWTLGVLGSMAGQGPLLFWAACHRRHHRFSDSADDPHSPRHGGEGLGGWALGLWYAHVGWMFRHEPEPWGTYVPDLIRDDLAFRLNRTYPIWVGLGLGLPAVVAGLLGGWERAFGGFLWGGLARIFLVHHITWSVNSICHCAGGRPYETGDDSRNNLFCGLLALGEGWHNNHHAFPTSARHGLEWWQLDVTYLLIRSLAAIGLARDVNLPGSRLRARKARRVEGPAEGPLLIGDAIREGGPA